MKLLGRRDAIKPARRTTMRLTLSFMLAIIVTLGIAAEAAAAHRRPHQAKHVTRHRTPQAPIGHRQPNARDVPAQVLRREGSRTKSQKDLDNKLKDICRGC